MSEPEKQYLIEFERLNVLGKAIFLTGAAVRTTASLIDLVLDRAADVFVEAERAYLQGRDPNVDDAKVLKEWREDA